MKALLLDAGLSEGDRTSGAARTFAGELERAGFEVDHAVLRELDMRACVGCFGCWVKTPGQCVIADDTRGLVERWAASDLVAVATPVIAGCYGSLAKRVLDRQICQLLPFFTRVDGEIHHELRYGSYPAYLVLGTLPEHSEAQEELFARLVERNALNMHVPPHACGVVAGDEPAETAVSLLLAETLGRTEVAV